MPDVIPQWLVDADPDAARRIAQAYARNPQGEPREVPLRRASVRRISQYFRHAYDWMRWQMLLRNPTATGRYPAWLWPAAPESWLGSLEYCQRGDVVAVVLAPRSESLLSDFGDWHFVLNLSRAAPVQCVVCGVARCAVHDPEDDDGPSGVQRWPTVTGERILELTDGWTEIFDQRLHEERDMQATCEMIRAEWVVAALELQRDARGYRWRHGWLGRSVEWIRGRGWALSRGWRAYLGRRRD